MEFIESLIAPHIKGGYKNRASTSLNYYQPLTEHKRVIYKRYIEVDGITIPIKSYKRKKLLVVPIRMYYYDDIKNKPKPEYTIFGQPLNCVLYAQIYGLIARTLINKFFKDSTIINFISIYAINSSTEGKHKFLEPLLVKSSDKLLNLILKDDRRIE